MLGLFIPQIRMDVATIEARVRAADEAGFDAVWFMDHLATPMGDLDCFEGWTIATAAALWTERVRVGHMVLCNAFRPPALLAKMAATLDHLSDGRLDLGLGWGSVPGELPRFGLGEPTPVSDRVAALEDTLHVLDGMFAGDAFDHAGATVDVHDARGLPRPRQARIPIHIGGGGARTVALARRWADWWNCPSYAVDRLRSLMDDLGGSTRVSVQHVVGLAPTAADREAVGDEAERRFGGWGGLVVGTPDDVASSLEAERALGVDGFVMQFSDFGRPETLRLFMDEVAPAITLADG